jgi:hypothetical protein
MFRYTDAQPWWNPISLNTPRRVGQLVWGMASGISAVVASTNVGIYRSTDEGLSWERTSALIPPHTFTIHLVYQEPIFFAVTTTPLSSSLLKSSDEGKTWESLGVFPIPNVLAIAIVDETFYLGGAGGLWRAPLSRLLTTVGEIATAPTTFRLQQNYPNPFNPSTIIGFQLTANSFVSLKVFDVLGREVTTLVNEQLKPGSYEATFDGNGLASGVYFYRLQAGEFVQTKKFVLQK